MRRIILITMASMLIVGLASTKPAGISFSHRLHIEDVGVECGDCHAAIESSSPTDNLLPDSATCYSCHDKDNTECGYCHVNPDDPKGPPRISTYIAKFPHTVHLTDEKSCSRCHTGVEKSQKTEKVYLPSMSLCQTCHMNIEEENYCLRCHDAKESLVPRNHKLDWRQIHGLASHIDKENCDMCHTEKQCLDCHQGDNLDRKVHPLNYINNHGIEARIKRDNCYACHEELESCVTCHREQLVLPRNHNTAGWSNQTTGGRHARVAKTDMDNCLACHNDNYGEPVCVQCHGAKE